MKRIVSLLLIAAVAGTSLQGCYGKMALTRKVYQVNGEVKDKYLRSLVSWVFIIVPVYGISALADFVLFNTIEFWSGKNPVAQADKEFTYAENGERYRIKAHKNGETVSYVIDHYRQERHVDTLSINWDTKGGSSSAILSEAGRATRFAALLDRGGVQVTSSEKGAATTPETVAFYR